MPDRYKSDPDIVELTYLVGAYQRKDIAEFENLLAANKGNIMHDNFIRMYIDNVLKSIRSQVLEKLIKPYSSISIASAAKVRM